MDIAKNNLSTRRRAALHNLGCKVNAYETEAMQQLLAEAGYEIVDFSETAEVYVINTCSVTNMADRKSRQMLHRARKQNPDAVIVAAGCYVQTAGEALKEELSIDILIGNNQKTKLVSLLEDYFKKQERLSRIIDINDGVKEYEQMHLKQTGGHTRAFIKVQDGCNQFCSYCIIPYARGRVRSREPGSVYEEASALAQNGYKEIVLTGIHLSSYGVGEDFGLLDLIRLVHGIEGIERIRLGSLEPRIITEEFAGALCTMPKVCPHFHLSLQSGCDATLLRMNRKYTSAEYEKSCELLRQVYEHPAITTDVIVGFPGETREEFVQCENFLKKIGFYEMHVFPYSKRRGTRAERMEGQVIEQVKKERSRQLLELVEKQSKEFRDFYIEKNVRVLFEEEVSIHNERYVVGFTPEYVRVAYRLTDGKEAVDYVNHILEGTVTRRLSGEIYELIV